MPGYPAPGADTNAPVCCRGTGAPGAGASTPGAAPPAAPSACGAPPPPPPPPPLTCALAVTATGARASAGRAAPITGARFLDGELGLLPGQAGGALGAPRSDSHVAMPRMPPSQRARSAARITSALGNSVSKQLSHLHARRARLGA